MIYHGIYVGPWDIMSQHFVRQGESPPGLTSFTKIRLGWITPGQVAFVSPGETRQAFLAPLSKGGATLVAKIPLRDGTYYLVENRQAIGYDKVLPDTGILVLKVSPAAQEGYGTVKIMDANPSAKNFTNATYRFKERGRSAFVDKQNNVAVIPLWQQGGDTGIVITSAEQSTEALGAAHSIDELAGRPGDGAALSAARAAFTEGRFTESRQIATKALNP